MTACFHCGEACPPKAQEVLILGQPRKMCCAGCAGVANTIVQAGLERYYSHREAPGLQDGFGLGSVVRLGNGAGVETPSKPGPVDETLDVERDFERLAQRRGFIQQVDDPEHGVQLQSFLMIDGMRCGACVWLLERGLSAADGVRRVQVNYAQQQALVQWDAQLSSLAKILARLRALGYRALPFDPTAREERLQLIERRQRRRLFVAGLAMMQVMMLQTPLYWAHPGDVEPGDAALLRWASMVVTLPALLYSGWPILQAAVRDVSQKHLGMDVPVAIGLLAAYLASAIHTWQGQGEVYFDTVTMFLFLLLSARSLEANARRRSQRWLDRLAAGIPQAIQRIGPDGTEKVLAEDLQVGDLIAIEPGASLPADAMCLEGDVHADCSLLSGESMPKRFASGEVLPSGAVIAEAQAVRLKVVRPASASTRADLQRLIARAGSTRPVMAAMADRAARYFVGGLLIFVLMVFAAWLSVNPARAFEIAVAVLVVSCPCALSLAVPAVLASVQYQLANSGVVLQAGDGLERLAQASDLVLDKTGTLSVGRPQVFRLSILDPAFSEHSALALALPLLLASPHPLAMALARHAAGQGICPSKDDSPGVVQGFLGQGMQASLPDGSVLKLGSQAFVRAQGAQDAVNDAANEQEDVLQEVWLAIDQVPIAHWQLRDALRDDALPSLQAIKAMGLRLHVLSGDRQTAVDALVKQLGLLSLCPEGRFLGAQLPQDKWAIVQAMQAEGRRVFMVGDGLNDAAVLAAADMSAAIGQASDLARLHAGALILSDRLASVVFLMAAARHAQALMRQNIAWATGYNLIAIPLAALGWIPAWGAALGMSLSSLVVVSNSLRRVPWKRSFS
ncbi:MAG: heavy metal translocating P-type ATPase [Betaproteobacteria bacterium]|nr:heavy metal translocating P-type ATPase [Betaproteobacteria bacterium]